VAQFKYLSPTETNRNLSQEEIKRNLNSGNACYPSVQNLLSSCLLWKNVTIRIGKTIILPVVLYGRSEFDCWKYGNSLIFQSKIPLPSS
jgi:hypothetical protein